jgi:hypothetical protein
LNNLSDFRNRENENDAEIAFGYVSVFLESVFKKPFPEFRF